MRRFLVSLIIFGLCPLTALGASTMSMPLPDSFPQEKKDLLLTITIPSKLPEPIKDQAPSRDHSEYFDLNPFPSANLTEEDWTSLKRMVTVGIATGQAQDLIKKKGVKSPYDLGIVTHNILRNASFLKKDYLLDKGMCREDVEFIESLVKRQENTLRSWTLDIDNYKKRLAALKQELRANKGEVRVVRVVSDSDGSTVIHLSLRENEQ